MALAECCIAGELGVDAALLAANGRNDALLFGEAQSRIVISVSPEGAALTEQRAAATGVPVTRIGVVGGERLVIGATIDLPIAALADSWEHGLARAAQE